MKRASIIFFCFTLSLATVFLVLFKMVYQSVSSTGLTNARTAMSKQLPDQASFYYDAIKSPVEQIAQSTPEPIQPEEYPDDREPQSNYEEPQERILTIRDGTFYLKDNEKKPADAQTGDSRTHATASIPPSNQDHLEDLAIIGTKSTKSILNYTLDIGIFYSERTVIDQVTQLQKKGFNAYYVKTKMGNRTAYLGRIGFYEDVREATNISGLLKKQGISAEVLPIVD